MIDQHAVEFVKHRKPQLTLTQERLDAVALYILSEIPALYTGITLNGTHYNSLLHPTFKRGPLKENERPEDDFIASLIMLMNTYDQFDGMKEEAAECVWFDLQCEMPALPPKNETDSPTQ